METTDNTVLHIIPAVRAILSYDGLKSGAFVPMDQLAEKDRKRSHPYWEIL